MSNARQKLIKINWSGLEIRGIWSIKLLDTAALTSCSVVGWSDMVSLKVEMFHGGLPWPLF
jgi:hypothetical protein